MAPRGDHPWDRYDIEELPQPSQRYVNRSLDNIPVRTSVGTASKLKDGRFPVAADHRHDDPPVVTKQDLADITETLKPMETQHSQSLPDDESYSPTASEIDVLEESFYDYEVQSTLAEGTDVFSQNVSQMSQIASSAGYVRDAATQSPISCPSPSSSVEDLEPCMFSDPKSLHHRLRMIWREFPPNQPINHATLLSKPCLLSSKNATGPLWCSLCGSVGNPARCPPLSN